MSDKPGGYVGQDFDELSRVAVLDIERVLGLCVQNDPEREPGLLQKAMGADKPFSRTSTKRLVSFFAERLGWGCRPVSIAIQNSP